MPNAGAKNWFYKALVIGMAPVLLAYFFPGRASITFAVGSIGGVVAQHFLPPRGRTRHLFLLLVLAIGFSILNWWLYERGWIK